MEGLYGLPVEISPTYARASGTVEWLLEAVERHARAEQDALDEYAFVADASADPVIALVMRLILEDEERHHGLLRRIEATLRDALNWTHSPSALPVSSVPQQPVARDLVALTRGLVQEELTGARMMRNLAQQEKGIDAGLHSLLLEMMAMDSEKHARLLQFVQHRLEQRARTTDGPSD
ncbi:MAG TPA: hypothetical protein VKV73_12455 [Chloroflexota bacterium]|nr:hypothetical protein [Chloroflexota bacterium]